MAFLGCVGVVVGSYAAAQASILVKAKGGSFHPASLVFGQMICGLPAIIVYSLAVEGNPLSFHWTWRAVICVLYLTIFGTIAAFWLVLLAFEPHRIDKGNDDIAGHAFAGCCYRLDSAG
jgi:drug/metabolite transporter (DMT)-like permease